MQLSTGMSAVYVKIKKKELTQFYSISAPTTRNYAVITKIYPHTTRFEREYFLWYVLSACFQAQDYMLGEYEIYCLGPSSFS